MKSYFEITASVPIISENNLRLILQYGAGIYGYILYSPARQSVVKTQLWEIGNNISSITELSALIQREISEEITLSGTILLNYHPGYIAIPNTIYESDKPEKWIELMTGRDPLEKILISKSEDQNIVHIQPLSIQVFETLNNTFQNLTTHSIQEFVFRPVEYKEDTICITFFNNHIFIAVYTNGSLQLNQAYPFSNQEDVLYLLLKIADQFSLERSSLVLIPEGFLEIGSTMYELLDQYFLNIQKPGEPLYRFTEDAIPHSPYILRHIDRIISCVS